MKYKQKLKKPNILMIVENYFPHDIRVRKEADALRGDYNLTVIAIKRDRDSFYEASDDLTIIRIPKPNIDRGSVKNRILRSTMSKMNYIIQYAYITIVSSLLFMITHPKKRYKAIHVHNPPDTLFVVGLLGKMFSVRFIFDHHDLSPEIYVTRFSGKRGMIYKSLILCEKLSCKLADLVVSNNDSYKRLAIDRHNIHPDKFCVVRNNPIISDCILPDNTATTLSKHDKLVLLFIGGINPQDGVDTLMRVIHHLAFTDNRKDFICNVIGGGDSLEQVKRLADDLGLHDFVRFTGVIYDRNLVREYLTTCDIGVEPAPYNEINAVSTFIKVMEYMAAAKPIVAFDLDETRYSADGSALFASPGNIDEFATAIKKLMDDPALRERMGQAGRERISQTLNWDASAANLRDAYRALTLS